MSRARPKRVLENVPEDDEAGWAPGAAFAEGGLHIPLDEPSTSTQEAESHRRQSVAALQKAGNVRSRLAAFEATLRLEPAEEVEVRRSWRPTWKKPKKDSLEAAPSPRNNSIAKSFAALRKSMPDSPATPLSDAKTPLRSSTGDLTPRGREASPFMKTVQGFLALRRSSASGLSISSQASPSEQEGNSSAAFSPLGGGLSNVADDETSGAAAQQEAEEAPPADAVCTQEAPQRDDSAQLPAPASAGKAGLGAEGSLAARLAGEAAVQARKKASPHAAAAEVGPSGGSSAAATSQLAAEVGTQPEAPLQVMEGPLVMTVGAAEPLARRRGARSPRGPVPSRPEAGDEGITACSAGVTPVTGALSPVLSAPTDAPQVKAAPAPSRAPDDAVDDNAVSREGHGSVLLCQASDDGLIDGVAAELQAAAPATPVPDSRAVAQLEIPDSEAVTPEGRAGAQQISPLLMSIKKLVSQQAAVESEHSLAITPGSENSNADGLADSIEDSEHLPAPAFSTSPSPIPQGPHSRRGPMLEADNLSNPVTSPILGSSGLRDAVAAAQARVVADLEADASSEQHAEELSTLSQLPDTPLEHVGIAPAQVDSKEDQAGEALATVVRDSMGSSSGSSAANEQPHTGQASMHRSASPGSEDTAAFTAHGQDAGPEDSNPAESHSATLEKRPCALSIEVESSRDPAQPESASTAAAQHAGAAASPFHSLASPNRFLEGSQSPELQASMSPGTAAGITLQPIEGPSLPCTASSVDSPSMRAASDSCLSPAVTEPVEAFTPASHAEAVPRQTAPEQTVAHTGHLAAQLPKLDSGDLDDASSATETASIADSDAPLEATLCSAGENPIAPQTADSEHSHVTPEHCQIWRSFRTPEREPQHPVGGPLSPPQRAALDGAPFTAAAALMLRSPGARHSPLSPRSRLSPRSMPPLPHSRLFAVSPRSTSSPELDSPLEEAVEELISATCIFEDVQVPPSTSKKAASAEGLVRGEADSPNPLSKLLPVPTAHSVPMPAGSPAPAAIVFGQHVQPLSPFPMGDSPALGTGYTAPQNTPAVGLLSGNGGSRLLSMTPSPYQAAQSTGVAHLHEEGATVSSTPTTAPGVQDLLAAFRRAAGQERAPPVSPAPAQPDTPGSLMDSPIEAASQARPIATGPASPREEQLPGLEKAAGTDGLLQNEPLETTEPEVQGEAGTAAKVAQASQGDQAGEEPSADDVAASHIDTADDLGTSEAVAESVLAPVGGGPAQEATTTEAASSAAAHVEQLAEGLGATETVEKVFRQPQAPEVASQWETGTAAVTPPPALPAEEAAAATPAPSQEAESQELAAEQGSIAAQQNRSPSKASRESHSPEKTGKASRPQRLQLEDAENVPSPPISPGQAGSGGPRAAVSPTKLTQKLGSPGSQMRSPLAQRLLQPLSPAQEMNAQSAAMDEVEHLHVMTPAPAEIPHDPSTGVQLTATPATAPRAANPAAFLRNTNSMFSPDVPAEAGTHDRQAQLHSPAPDHAEGSIEDLDAKFNLAQFSPPAARRLSTGQTPPLPAAMSRSGSQPPSSRRAAEAPQQLPGQRQVHVTLDMRGSSQEELGAALEETKAADLPTPGRGPGPGDEHYVEPESPVFDEAFVLDTQLILGSLVTPATAAQPPAQRHAGPAEPAQQALPDVAAPSQKACEIVEEAAAEAGLIKEDTARLVKVMGHFLDALMGELSEGEAQRSVLDLATQNLRQKCEVLVDDNRQLRKDLQEQETEMFKVREDHANTEQQFKTLYRSKYLPLKEEVQECRQDIARLKACRAADAEACEKWRAQVATQQLQIRKADTDAEANSMKIRSLQAELQAATAAAAKAAALQQDADVAALQAAKRASKLEDQLHAARAEQEVLVTQSEEASARVAAAQAARDRAVKEGYAKEEESFSLKKRLQEFKRENDKFADIKAQLKGQVAQLQDSLAKKEEENQNLLAACEQLVSEREAARSESIPCTS